MNPIYNLRHKIQMLKDFLQLLSTGPVTTRLISLAVEMYRMKGLLKFLQTRTPLIQQKITEKVGLYTNNT